MRYYKYPEEGDPEPGGGLTYSETDDGCAFRQITVNGNDYIASNRPHPPWGFCLADQQIDYDALGDAVTEISPAEFEAIWQQHLSKYQDQWLVSKQLYPPGTAVQGWIEIFFPQGVIVNLGDGTFGVANYAQCRASTVPGAMYPHHKVTAIVSGYDEANQWLVLGQPQVYNERIDKA
jgi:hypothetical protein